MKTAPEKHKIYAIDFRQEKKLTEIFPEVNWKKESDKIIKILKEYNYTKVSLSIFYKSYI